MFERADSPGRIYLERYWITGQGRVRLLADGTTRAAAEVLATKTASKREELLLRGRDAFGDQKEMTLFVLYERYHASTQSKKWGIRHRREQDRCRDFWKMELRDLPVRPEILTHELVEGKAQDAAERAGWSDRTHEKYLKYLMAATRWGKRKGRCYRVDPLDGLDLPEVISNTSKLTYAPEDARKLLEPHERIDWRVTLAFAITVATGRRISSILHLWAGMEDHVKESDVAVLTVPVRDPATGETRELESMFLHFRAEHDKGGRDEWVPVPDRVRSLIEEAVEREPVWESGWLLPEGRLEYRDKRHKPMDATSIIDNLHNAEDVLGIERVRGRGYHGGKRLHVTMGMELAGGDATIVGDVTGNASEHVIKTIYRQKDLGRMVLQVDGVDAILGANTDSNTDKTREGEAG